MELRKYFNNVKDLDSIIIKIRSHLTSDLLAYGYKIDEQNPTYGFCSIASEALYFILGGKRNGISSYVCKDEDGSTHWWLKDSAGNIIDPTSNQYTIVNKLPPYERGIAGRPCGFMGIRVDVGNKYGFDRKPSKRARILLDRILI